MYAAMLRHRPEFRDIKRSNTEYNKYRNMQLNLLENVKKEIEMKKAKSQSIEMRNKLLEYRDKVNYQNEMDRIRGYLSRNDTRFPIGDLTRLRERQKELKELVKDII